jgi:hypothetical protein
MSRSGDAWVGNAVFFQLVWFAAVIGAGRGHAVAGVVAVVLFACWQLRAPDTRSRDLRLIALSLLVGTMLDSAFAASGMIRYAAAWPSPVLAPAWILALWTSLALSLNHSLRWLQASPVSAAAAGAIAAPLSYLAAAQGWQAVAFAEPRAFTLSILSASWAVAMPLLVLAARHWRDPAPVAPALGNTESSP